MIVSVASKSFGNKQILGSITLELKPGSITAIMGPSGSGKTTLLRIIAGLEQDDQHTQRPSMKIGMMFQEPHLLPWKTAIDNIEIAGPENGLLRSLGLADATPLYPRQVSLGMARRIAFARAIASKPDLLILDEPFVSLDADLVDIMRTHILEISKATKIPVLVTTHHRDDAIALGAALFTLEGTPALLHRVA